MEKLCDRCGKATQQEKLVKYGGEKLCSECIMLESQSPEICPNCGHVIQETDWVGIQVRHLNPSTREKAADVEALAIICPECRIMFFDKFQFNIIKGLK